MAGLLAACMLLAFCAYYYHGEYKAAAKDLQMHKNEQIAQSINIVQKNEADKTHSTDYDNLNSL